MEHNLLIHRREDHAGIAVTDIKAGEKAKGIILADGSRIELDALQDVPLAHKMAIKAAAPGDKVVLTGHPAGEATHAIQPGEHVHVHNMKSLRWS